MTDIEILVYVIKTDKCPENQKCFDCPALCWVNSTNETITKKEKAKRQLRELLFKN